MTSKVPSSGSEPLTGGTGPELRPCDSEGYTDREDRAYTYAFAIYDDTRGPTNRVRRVMALADAEQADLKAEVARLIAAGRVEQLVIRSALEQLAVKDATIADWRRVNEHLNDELVFAGKTVAERDATIARMRTGRP